MSPDFLVYCERLQPGMWAEPANLFSNVGFLLAGGWALNRCRRLAPGVQHWDLWTLALLILVIGAGSALWHSFHTPWAKTLDIVPILLFIHLYLYTFLHRQLGLHVAAAIMATLLYFVASKAFTGLVNPHLLHGSIFYLPALVALAALAVWSYAKRMPSRRMMLVAMLLFVVSLVFRTIDGDVCAYLPMGTHFLWHLLNACLLAVLVAVAPGRVNRD